MKNSPRLLALLAAVTLAVASCATLQPGGPQATGERQPLTLTRSVVEKLARPANRMKVIAGQAWTANPAATAQNSGRISLRIHWPERRTQAMPYNTHALYLSVTDPTTINDDGSPLEVYGEAVLRDGNSPQYVEIPSLGKLAEGFSIPTGDFALAVFAVDIFSEDDPILVGYGESPVSVKRNRITPVFVEVQPLDETPPPPNCEEDPNAPGCDETPGPTPTPATGVAIDYKDYLHPIYLASDDTSQDLLPSQIQLSATLYGLEDVLVWESFNEAAATVDENGLVTAGTKTGEAVIFVSAKNNPNYTDYAVISVKDGGLVDAEVK